MLYKIHYYDMAPRVFNSFTKPILFLCNHSSLCAVVYLDTWVIFWSLLASSMLARELELSVLSIGSLFAWYWGEHLGTCDSTSSFSIQPFCIAAFWHQLFISIDIYP